MQAISSAQATRIRAERRTQPLTVPRSETPQPSGKCGIPSTSPSALGRPCFRQHLADARLRRGDQRHPPRGRRIAHVGPEEVRQRYGVDPNQVPDFIALRGDPSDNCLALLESGKTRGSNWYDVRMLDGVLEVGLFQTQGEMLRLFRLIATMDAFSPCPRSPIRSRHGPQHRALRAVGG
jgi:hypothetical protein